MNLYSLEQTRNIQHQKFAFLKIAEEDHVLTITLDRAAKKNALHPHMVKEIAYAMHFAHFNKEIWIIVFEAEGNVFCAGADLKAMVGLIEPNDSTIPEPSGEVLIGELFNKVYKPTIAKVTGDVFAGGFFFLAGCNIVLAQDNVRFGLPEVKRGLYPFQVMAALLKVMPPRKVIDWCIRGYNLSVSEAERFGLVTKVCKAENINVALLAIIDELKENSPSGISKGLEAFDHIRPSGEDHKYLMEMFQKTISSPDGQEGLKAFQEKRKPDWVGG